MERISYELVSQRLIEEYRRRVRPNVYCVLHLNRFIRDPLLGTLSHGTAATYDQAAYELLRDVSKKVFGKSGYRRRPKHNKRLPNIVTLESRHECPHLNVLLNKPDWLPFDDLEKIIDEVWFQNPWAAAHSKAFYFEPTRGDCIGYSLKEGSEAILPRPLSFLPDSKKRRN